MFVLGLAAASYALDAIWIAAFVPSGAVTWRVAAGYATVTGLTCATFALFIARGWNLRLRDPHMTVAQAGIAYLIQLAFLWAAPSLGPLFLGSMIIVSAFSALTMTTRQFAWTWVLVSLAAGGVMWHVAGTMELPVATRTQQVLVWLVASSILGRVILLNERVVRLRVQLARKHGQLRESLARLQRESAERLRAEQALYAAQKLESIGRLAGGVAHDLNNQLTVVIGHTALLRSRLESPSDRADLASISEAAGRAARLTTELLTFARRRPSHPVVLDLNTLLADTVPMLAHLVEGGVVVELRPYRPLWGVWADRSQLELLLINLCVNASDAMPHGGRLTIETSHVTLDAQEARAYDGIEAGDFVRLTVRDTGVGISEHLLGQIFEPFFTTKEFGKGTGLGLSACYGVVRQCGGHIGVSSTVGAGTVFEILLPRSHGMPNEVASAPGADAAPRGNDEVILVVDDMPEARFVVRRMLESAGYRVHEAINGEEALAELNVRGVTVDLVLSDVVMPVMNGRALSDHLGRSHPALPVVLMSAYSAEVLGHDGLLDARRPFLAKPLALDALLSVVGACLAVGEAREAQV